MADTAWHTSEQADLIEAITEFKAKLPGWWYTLGECQVSCDASCAPTVESEHIHLIPSVGNGKVLRDDPFDSGFHADLRQPSTMAEALRTVMREALGEIANRAALLAKEPTP